MNICFGETIPENAKPIYQELSNNAEAAAYIDESLKEELTKMKDTNAPLELLALKLDNDLLKSEASKSELLKGAEQKLQGTVIGEMMDQMSDDMCNLALNPSMQCSGVVEARSAYVNDAANILKEMQNQRQVADKNASGAELKK